MNTNDQKEAFSNAYVRAVASVAGYDCCSPEFDRESVDIIFRSQVSPYVSIESQLKATSSSNIIIDNVIHFPLKIKNYNELRGKTASPRILIILILPNKPDNAANDMPENWINQTPEQLILRKCAYWIGLENMPETDNMTSINIKIPMNEDHIFTPKVLEKLAEYFVTNRMGIQS
ncbi:hypothetical protein FACS189472_05060 [Alphaproteobacteria bacterium]|nr:hypothetical protein FACS189472_05060 [Alphaproteobacteria bacterium]